MKTRIEPKDVVPVLFETHILDDNNNIVRVLAANEAQREYVPIDRIPDGLVNGLIAVEDKRFYRHHGIDHRGILRAAYVIVRSRGKDIQGGSTITQQLIKNSVFTEWNNEKTFADSLKRKIFEALFSVQLERQIGKTEILEYYMNVIYFGYGCYGVQTASRKYFNKNVWELDLGECALLAGLPQNPGRFDPFRNLRSCEIRRRYVLDSMLYQGMIGKKQYHSAVKKRTVEKFIGKKTESTRDCYSYYEDALICRVSDDLSEKFGLSGTESYKKIYSGGLRIYTAEYLPYQKVCEKIFEDTSLFPDAENEEHMQAALILLDPFSGYVLASVGGIGKKNADLLFDRSSRAKRNSSPKALYRFLQMVRCENTYPDGINISDLCAAMAAYENGGTLVKPNYYKKVTDSRGNVLLSAEIYRHSEQNADYFPMPEFTEITLQKDVWIIGNVNGFILGIWTGYDHNADIPVEKPYYTCARKLWKAVRDQIADHVKNTITAN